MLLMVVFLLGVGCSDSGVALKEPEGTPVVLTEKEGNPGWAGEAYREWAGWNSKGVSLTNAGRHDEALYCLDRALEAWPVEDPRTDEQKKKRRTRHFPEPTTTLLKKGELYLLMEKPDLAMAYFKRFDKYLPNSKYCVEGMKKAEAMMAAQKSAG